MDIYGLGMELQNISQMLESIRVSSKGQTTDFKHYPYNDDLYLLRHLLQEKINEIHEENKKQRKKLGFSN